ncbi:MAG: hypothetical protein A2X36_16250 [Elusimicrobia bacterium GWA2_69_24]|nr:MAG: hypothetical protein A2X36_16250 [Elusimicrobia bacterium GWA2_69_24]HBL19106.1 hypothetical protein [Elusimicrobiota bacterium]
MNLSVIVITRDEEHNLAACLESVRGLDPEIVVLDNASTDRTVEIARRYTPLVSGHPFRDFASQKQAALDRATREWVLSIDADERVSPALAEELRVLLASPAAAAPSASGYEIPFEVEFMGRKLRFGGLGRERHLRLFRRAAGAFRGDFVHESVAVRGSVGRLRQPIRHIPYRDLDEYLAKMRVYTGRAARKRWEQGRRFHAGHLLLPLWEFFARAVLKLGVLDGTPGIVWAGLSAFHTWVKYLKLRELGSGAREGSR